ncbi:unnamed protein product [Parajaminaea phylloscopi]
MAIPASPEITPSARHASSSAARRLHVHNDDDSGAQQRQASTLYVGADDWEESPFAEDGEEAVGEEGRSRWDREFERQWTKSRSSSVASAASQQPAAKSRRAIEGGFLADSKPWPAPHPEQWTPSGMLKRGVTSSNTTLGRGGSQLIQGYLNFSASRGGMTRTFALSPSSVSTLTFETLARILELDKRIQDSSWADPKAKPRLSRPPSSSRFFWSARSPSVRRQATLYIEHRVVPVSGGTQPRPYSRWSQLTPWPGTQDTLQGFLMADFFRRQLHEGEWTVLSIKERGENAPAEDEAFGPGGTVRVGKGLSRLSWGLGNLFGNNDWPSPSDGSRLRQRYVQLGLEDEPQGTEPLLGATEISKDRKPHTAEPSVFGRFMSSIFGSRHKSREQSKSPWSRRSKGPSSGAKDEQASRTDHAAASHSTAREAHASASQRTPEPLAGPVRSATSAEDDTTLETVQQQRLRTRLGDWTKNPVPRSRETLRKGLAKVKMAVRSPFQRSLRTSASGSTDFNERERRRLKGRQWLSPVQSDLKSPSNPFLSNDDPVESAPAPRIHQTSTGVKSSPKAGARALLERTDVSVKDLDVEKLHIPVPAHPAEYPNLGSHDLRADRPLGLPASFEPSGARESKQRRAPAAVNTPTGDFSATNSEAMISAEERHQLVTPGARAGTSQSQARDRAFLNSTLEIEYMNGDGDSPDIPQRKSSSQDDAYLALRAARAEERLSVTALDTEEESTHPRSRIEARRKEIKDLVGPKSSTKNDQQPRVKQIDPSPSSSGARVIIDPPSLWAKRYVMGKPGNGQGRRFGRGTKTSGPPQESKKAPSRAAAATPRDPSKPSPTAWRFGSSGDAARAQTASGSGSVVTAPATAASATASTNRVPLAPSSQSLRNLPQPTQQLAAGGAAAIPDPGSTDASPLAGLMSPGVRLDQHRRGNRL